MTWHENGDCELTGEFDGFVHVHVADKTVRKPPGVASVDRQEGGRQWSERREARLKSVVQTAVARMVDTRAIRRQDESERKMPSLRVTLQPFVRRRKCVHAHIRHSAHVTIIHANYLCGRETSIRDHGIADHGRDEKQCFCAETRKRMPERTVDVVGMVVRPKEEVDASNILGSELRRNEPSFVRREEEVATDHRPPNAKEESELSKMHKRNLAAREV